MLIGCICFLLVSLFGGEKACYVLLDKMIITFNEMSKSGVTDRDKKIQNALDEMMADAKKAKAQGQVDLIFYDRYTRILLILKFSTIHDPEGILMRVQLREFIEFIKDIEGKEFRTEEKSNIFGPLAESIAKEISSLKEYLDNQEKSGVKK
jgi:hypothetical protein